MTDTRVARIEKRLRDAFAPTSLLVRDQSHLHAGHAGAASGGGHYQVRIVAPAFEGLTRIACHQKIYAALGDMMAGDIHALKISAGADESD